MPAKLVIAPEAELDIAEAYVWYERRRIGLGEEFLTSVDASIVGIRRQPEIYPLIHETYRRSLVRRFPYAVFFEYAEPTVTVYSVFTRLATRRNGASASPDPQLYERSMGQLAVQADVTGSHHHWRRH
jgi:plasmid stabilization system protein ParE